MILWRASARIDYADWHDWFAWRPVGALNEHGEWRMVWLEPVRRRFAKDPPFPYIWDYTFTERNT